MTQQITPEPSEYPIHNSAGEIIGTISRVWPGVEWAAILLRPYGRHLGMFPTQRLAQAAVEEAARAG